mmetsp:Transcript_102764/g.265654  ORF Transcript_102764/g.265654 Transcript_102764/m.265654 type:complete len:525 (-) Transcript_102764:42-1616(-)
MSGAHGLHHSGLHRRQPRRRSHLRPRPLRGQRTLGPKNKWKNCCIKFTSSPKASRSSAEDHVDEHGRVVSHAPLRSPDTDEPATVDDESIGRAPDGVRGGFCEDVVDLRRGGHVELESAVAGLQPLHRLGGNARVAIAHDHCRDTPVVAEPLHHGGSLLEQVHCRPILGLLGRHRVVRRVRAENQHALVVRIALHYRPVHTTHKARDTRALVNEQCVALEHVPLVRAEHDVSVVDLVPVRAGARRCELVGHAVGVQRPDEPLLSAGVGDFLEHGNVRGNLRDDPGETRIVVVCIEDVEVEEASRRACRRGWRMGKRRRSEQDLGRGVGISGLLFSWRRRQGLRRLLVRAHTEVGPGAALVRPVAELLDETLTADTVATAEGINTLGRAARRRPGLVLLHHRFLLRLVLLLSLGREKGLQGLRHLHHALADGKRAAEHDQRHGNEDENQSRGRHARWLWFRLRCLWRFRRRHLGGLTCRCAPSLVGRCCYGSRIAQKCLCAHRSPPRLIVLAAHEPHCWSRRGAH